ncbi:MAG: beta-ketoacyl-ACP synthase [Vitreoscilla sp.]|jgi:3-oxoacyl-[acyl-carrier-protein] synthase II|nr:beta-ketoacyl-ACP synthase [Vitreoscilla sp.]
MKRVVVTGMSSITSLGEDAETIMQRMQAGESGIRYMPEWERYADLRTRLGGPVLHFTEPAHFTRKVKRGMGRVALMATIVAERALDDAGLLGDDIIGSGQTGVAFGSSSGNVEAIAEFGAMVLEDDVKKITATSYIRMMGHTTAVNISVYFGLKGRTLPTSCACTSGSMAIGQAYEAIKYGKQTVMIAGGAEELSATQAAVFDVLFATSCRHDAPQLTPRPYDKDRDGLVIGEGAGCLILEEYEHAVARGATIYAELVGYGSNTDGMHVTQPNRATMAECMRLSLADAALQADAIHYINGHGTATEQGDIAESQATMEVMGTNIPISSLKGYFGHTLGACGAIEAMLAITMMQQQTFIANLNLDQVDTACAPLNYIQGQAQHLQAAYIMSNNFAFGGINTSLIFRNVQTH